MRNLKLIKRASILLVITIMFTLVGCSLGQPSKPTLSETLKDSSDKVAANQQKLEQKQPAPDIDYSNERANLIKRAVTFNDPNKVSYLYEITKAGTVLAFYTVKGKVSNLSSYLVPDEQVVKDPYYKNGSSGSTYQGVVIQAPDIDGSYGTNGTGIFFYTTDGTYVEWNGEYQLSDQPLKLATQPVLTRDVK